MVREGVEGLPRGGVGEGGVWRRERVEGRKRLRAGLVYLSKRAVRDGGVAGGGGGGSGQPRRKPGE